MDQFRITGGTGLEGELPVSGAKNSALPALAACLLTEETVTLRRIPQVRDIGTMEKLLAYVGANIDDRDGVVTVKASNVRHSEAPYDIVKTMRASSLVLGPLLWPVRACPGIHAGWLRNWRAPHQLARFGLSSS